MKKSIVVLLSFVFLLTACNEIHLSMKDSGKTIKASVGTVLAITLVSNRSTGNSWHNMTYDHAVIEPVGKPEYKKNQKGLAGAPGEVIYTFKTIGKGKTGLTMEYGSPNQKDKKALKKFNVNIVVE